MKIRRIEDRVQNHAPQWSNIHVIPRGLPVFADQNLRGTIRFSKRQGNFLPILAADNVVELAADADRGAQDLLVTRLVSSIQPGNIISIGNVEKQLVADVNTDEGRIILQEPLITSHSAGSEVLAFATPVEVIGPVGKGATTLQIRSSFKVFNGDNLVIRTEETLLRSAVEFKIAQVRFLGTSELLYNHELTLEVGIPRALAAEEEIFFKEQAGYESPDILTPGGVEEFGPFLLDYISGPLIAGVDVEETLSIQLFDGIGDPLPGFIDPVTVGKNYPITQVPVNNESMLMWDLIKGSLQFDDQNKVILICDENGEFALSKHIVPFFPPGSEWEMPVRANSNALFRVKVDPQGYRDFSLIAGQNQRPLIGVGAAEAPGTRIEIVIKSVPFAQVEVNNWQPPGSVATSIRYNITSDAQGDFRWEASGILFKPYFLNLDPIEARYDFSDYDAGLIYL